MYPDREQRGMLECEAAEHESSFDHVGLRVSSERQLLEGGAEKVVGVGAERRDQSVPGSKQAVDGARRGVHLGSDPAYRQRLESSCCHCAFAGGEERGGGPLVVFLGSSHP